MTLQKRKNSASNNQTWTLQQNQAKPTLCNPTNYLSTNPPNCLRDIIQGLISKVHLRGLRARQVNTTRERLDALWRSSFQETPTKKTAWFNDFDPLEDVAFFDQLKVEVCISCLREFDGELFESGLKPRKRVHFRTAAEFFHETQRSVLVSEVSLWQNRMSPGVSSMQVAVASLLQLYFSPPSNFEWGKNGSIVEAPSHLTLLDVVFMSPRTQLIGLFRFTGCPVRSCLVH